VGKIQPSTGYIYHYSPVRGKTTLTLEPTV
jgi:hypothetical protein